jgi:hypothetical protein
MASMVVSTHARWFFKTLEPALDLFFSRELQAGAVAGDQPGHGILGAINAGGNRQLGPESVRGTGSSSLMCNGNSVSTSLNDFLLPARSAAPAGWSHYPDHATPAGYDT